MKRKRKATPPEPAGITMDRDYQAEDDMRTLERAHEVLASSPRLAAAKRMAKEKKARLDRISRLEGRRL